MGNFDWKATLATVAPTIAAALGGPLAGVAVSAAASALGVEPDEQNIAEALSYGNPETLVQLRDADNKLKTDLKKLDVDLEEIHGRDRASARKLGIERGIVVQTVLSATLGFAFAWVLIHIFTGDMNLADNMRDIAIYALGTLNTLLVQVFNYWFGSSSGSKDKTKALQKAMH